MGAKTMTWRAGGVAAVAALAIIGAATPAMASQVNGSCTASRGNFGNVRTDYHVSGATTVIDKFNWNLGGPGLGNKSNVNLQQKIDVSRGSDPVLYSFNSPDSVRPGAGSHTPTQSVTVPLEKATYTNYQMIFDRTGFDPSCTARTVPNI
jgi:hypothetical protein